MQIPDFWNAFYIPEFNSLSVKRTGETNFDTTILTPKLHEDIKENILDFKKMKTSTEIYIGSNN